MTHKPMLPLPRRLPEAAIDPALEEALGCVELQLAALGEALRMRDANGIDTHATELQRALSRAVDHFSQAARKGPLPQALRRRLASAGGEVAAQRESLARATAALDRAIDVLIPRGDAPGLYSAFGSTPRGPRGGVIQA